MMSARKGLLVAAALSGPHLLGYASPLTFDNSRCDFDRVLSLRCVPVNIDAFLDARQRGVSVPLLILSRNESTVERLSWLGRESNSLSVPFDC